MNKLMHAREQETRIRNARIDAWFDLHFPPDGLHDQAANLALRADLKRRLSEPLNPEETL